MLTSAWAIAIAVALQSPPPPATGPDHDDRPLTHLVQNLAHDACALPSRDTAAILAAGALGAGLMHAAADQPLADWVQRRDPSSYTVIGRTLGNGWMQGGAALATYVVGVAAKRPLVTHVGSDLIRAQVLNGVITTGVKIAVDRTRPSGSSRAFPSGHTSASFASAEVLREHFGWKVGLPAFAAAGFVGWTRIRDDQHWLSDVIFGAAIGVVSGHTVASGHRRQWAIVPARTAGGIEVIVVRIDRRE